jgi:hypothetical protein
MTVIRMQHKHVSDGHLANKREGNKTFRYVFDQTSPFQPSSRAHHTVDLLFLFGTYSGAFLTEEYVQVGKEMREKWIEFLHGSMPWDEGTVFKFGPLGRCSEVNEDELQTRRRVAIWKMLDSMDSIELNRIFVALTKGRISLLN